MRPKSSLSVSLLLVGFLMGVVVSIVFIHEMAPFYEGGSVSVDWEDLENPTMKELRDFLDRDQTDVAPYGQRISILGDVKERDCVDFASELRNNAMAEGYDLDVVILSMENNRGHALNGARLENGDYVYIEPQNDEILTLENNNYQGYEIYGKGVIH